MTDRQSQLPLPCCSTFAQTGEHTDGCRTPIYAKMAADRKARMEANFQACGHWLNAFEQHQCRLPQGHKGSHEYERIVPIRSQSSLPVPAGMTREEYEDHPSVKQQLPSSSSDVTRLTPVIPSGINHDDGVGILATVCGTCLAEANAEVQQLRRNNAKLQAQAMRRLDQLNQLEDKLAGHKRRIRQLQSNGATREQLRMEITRMRPVIDLLVVAQKDGWMLPEFLHPVIHTYREATEE